MTRLSRALRGASSPPHHPVPLYPLLRPLLFGCDPERAHHLGIVALRAAQAVPGGAVLLGGARRTTDPLLAQRHFGRDFPNPVGLAAGFDKNAVAIDGLAALGFGFVEVGTVTPLPQAGNPRPRLFRHSAHRSLQNALGFNNQGLEALHCHLTVWRRRHPDAADGGGHTRTGRPPLGVNVGKGRDTPADAALADYEGLLGALGPLADYLVVNLSSPNTPGLRDLQNEGFVRALLRSAGELTPTPVLVKLSPDLAPEAAAALAAVAVDAGAAGIIATNTSIDYTLVPGARTTGGISGRALRDKSRQSALAIGRQLRGTPALLVSAGGIDSGAEAYRRIRSGAALVQLYTALVYEGPGLVHRINRDLAALLRRDGYTHLSQAIGADL